MAKIMRRKVILGVLLLGSSAWAKAPQRDVLGELEAKVNTLASEVKNLSATSERLQRDVDVLKLNAAAMGEEQRSEVEKIAEKVIQTKDFPRSIDQQVNALSSAFSKEINGLAEKFQGAWSHVTAAVDAQQKIVNMLPNAPAEQPGGVAYEVKAGETLEGIAAQHGVTREALLKSNFIADENHLQAGQMIFIPKEK
ncbi:MAG: LysM peptidoglycan-binding domain-containing protein [Puniceicoccales bacterium]|nr:LysM peptidoglycan-binding domain-containing protein [Puniceicoccales bacterium]